MLKFVATCAVILTGLGATPSFAEPRTDWGDRPEGANWSRFVREAIVADGNRLVSTVPGDMRDFCPKYAAMGEAQRRDVWARLFSLLAYYESSYKPGTWLRENFKDSNGNWVISRGLLQISKESANGRRYRCRIVAESSLHDPRINMSCGAKIAAAWITADGRIFDEVGPKKWRGMARYWSPFRVPEKRAKIAALLSASNGCR